MSRKHKGKKNNKSSASGYSDEPVFNKNTAALYDTVYVCSLCGNTIKDISSALSNKTDDSPVHFDCVLKRLKEIEPLKDGEHIIYIGKGKFAVITYASPVTMKEFSIVRSIEWEEKKDRSPWRDKISEAFSEVR